MVIIIDRVSRKSTSFLIILLFLDPSMFIAKDITHISLITDSLVLSMQLHLLNLLDPIGVIKTMISIFWNCIKLNNTIGKYG